MAFTQNERDEGQVYFTVVRVLWDNATQCFTDLPGMWVSHIRTPPKGLMSGNKVLNYHQIDNTYRINQYHESFR